jgi:hypothetical protein
MEIGGHLVCVYLVSFPDPCRYGRKKVCFHILKCFQVQSVLTNKLNQCTPVYV